MSGKDLLVNRNRQPFVPFQLVMADGRRYEVRHPELLTVGRTSSLLSMADKDEDYILADHFIWLDNNNVTTLIPLTVADQVG